MRYSLQSVEAVKDRPAVTIILPDGSTRSDFYISKEKGHRAELICPEDVELWNKELRVLQREAVKNWAEALGGLTGFLDSGLVSKGCASLTVSLKSFCPVCDCTTLSEFEQWRHGIANFCTFCGTLRKPRSYITDKEYKEVQEFYEYQQHLNARNGKGALDAAETEMV